MQWQHWPHLQRSTLLQCHFLLQHVAQEPPDVVSAGVVTTSSAPPSAHAQPSPEAAWQRRCNGTVGTWCTAALSQEAFPWKAPPEHSKACQHDCNGVGTCNHDTGLCLCPAGWAGDDCMQRQKRPCTNRWRTAADNPQEPYGLVQDPWKEPGWTASRCAGELCVFGAAGGCLWHDDLGNEAPWGGRPREDLFGPLGCSPFPCRCACLLDGLGGDLCDTVYEAFCPAQCSGNGECQQGFCKCSPGFYGHDCAKMSSNHLPAMPRAAPAAHLQDHINIPAARWHAHSTETPPPPSLRPLIYVYDLPAQYNSRMLQYRIHGTSCVYRRFNELNHSYFNVYTYAVESGLHEWLLQSRHRQAMQPEPGMTLDPEEADFFYVPAYASCYMHPVWGRAQTQGLSVCAGPRISHAAEMLLEVQQWLQKTQPFWDRKGGRDHIWLMSHDEGACWAPNAIWPSIMLTHWGRKDLLHTSNTAYGGDNYTEEHINPPWRPSGWHKNIVGHACYDPQKALYNLSKVHDWQGNYDIVIASSDVEAPGSYSEWLATSKFCLVAPGDGWSPRAEDSVLHGCIPVVIKDNVEEMFATLLDWSTFSIRIAEADLGRVPEILLSVTPERLHAMQQNLALVWHRFLWASPPAVAQHLRTFMPDGQKLDNIMQDDALSTLMQWLYSHLD
eukprot:jgi/Astpho2/4391/e_gw1.00067.84.1_t